MENSYLSKVAVFTADMTDVEVQLHNFQTLNSIVAKNVGQQYGSVAKIIERDIRKMSTVALIDEKGAAQGQKALQDVQTVVETTTGHFLKINEVMKSVKDENKGLTTSITNVTSKYSDLYKQQAQLQGRASGLSTDFNNLTDVNRKFAKQLQDTGSASVVIGQNLNKVTDNTRQFGYLMGTSKGQILQFTETINKLPNGVQEVSRSVTDVTDKFNNYQNSTANADKNTVSFGDNIARLAKRALLTIPIWFALRQSIMGVNMVIRDGIKTIIEQDKAFQKLKRNLSATSSSLTADFSKVSKEIEDFSIRSGVGVDKVTEAVQKFATVGFDMESSLAGGIAATKLSVTLFGEAEDTANAFARSLRVMTEDMDSTEEKQNAINNALALTDKLWKTNAFEIDEFSGNLEKFAGTAKIANLSIDDTIKLLATLSTGGLANRAGQLIRTSLLKSLTQVDKITNALNLKFDPRKQSTIEFILQMVGALKKIKSPDNLPIELMETLGDIFTVKSTETFAALTALEKTLKANIAVTSNMKELTSEFEKQQETINRLNERYHNLNKEIGKTFVQGLVGGDDYAKSLKRIVDVQEKLRDSAGALGYSIKHAMFAAGVAGAIAYHQQLLVLAKTLATNIIPLIKSMNVATAAALATFTILNLNEQAKQLERDGKELIKQANKIGNDIGDNIVKGMKGQLDTSELKKLLITLETFGAKELKMPTKEFEKTVDFLKQRLELQKQINVANEEAEKSTISESNRQKVAEKTLEIELNKLRLQGALESEILKATNLLSQQFRLDKEGIELLDRKLKIEQAINEEKRLQSKLGSDSIKLYKIAQEQGVDVAKKIGDVLSGEMDFSAFIKQGGKAAEIFADQWADLFEAKQAEQFFKGEQISTLSKKGATGFDFNLFSKETAKDLSKLRGGSRIAIQEESIRGIDLSDASSKLQAAISEFQQIESSSSALNSAELQRLQRQHIDAVAKNTEALLTMADSLFINKIAGVGVPNQEAIIQRDQTDLAALAKTPSMSTPSSSVQVKFGDIKMNFDVKDSKYINDLIDKEFENMKQQTLTEVNNQLFGKQTPQ